MIRLFVLLLLIAPGAWAAPQAPTVASALDLVEWMFERPLTVIEMQVLSEQKGWEKWSEQAQGLERPGPDRRAALLRQFRADPEPFARTACEFDKLARKEIASGLQLQSSEAFAEWLLFGMAVIAGEQPNVLPGPNFRRAVQGTLAGLWPTLPVQPKEFLVGFPAYWAKMRKEWPKMDFAAKNRVVISWQNNLANTFTAPDRLRLASACLLDLQETMRSKPSPQALDVACDRLEFAARRLRQADTKATPMADDLALFAKQARQKQADEAHAQALLDKMDLPPWRPIVWAEPGMFPGYYGGWGAGWGAYPYRW